MLKQRVVSLFIVFFLYLPTLVQASDTPLKQDVPFQPGEKLHFLLRWEFVPAGEAILTVAPMAEVDGTQAFHFVMTVKTNSFLDMFYKVRDRVESYVDVDMTRSLLYKKKRREKKNKKRDVTVTFNWKDNQAQRIRNGIKKEPIALEPGTFDPLGVFYFVRNSKLDTDVVLERSVSDGDRCVIGVGNIIKRETITVPAGTFDTFLIEPDLKDVKGVFEKSDDANIYIWVTADRYHIPVKIQSKVVIGRFMGELTEANLPDTK